MNRTDYLNKKHIHKEIQDIKECIDKCCLDLPIVQYPEPYYRILCKWCFNETINKDSTKVIIEWNKMIRKENRKNV